MVDLTPVDYLSGLGGLANLPNPAREQAGAQALRTTQLQQQAAQLQLQQAEQQQSRQNQFYGDIAKLGDDPTPIGIASMIRKYPEFSEQLKQAHDIQDQAKRDSDFRVQSQIFAAAANGRYDLAADLLEKHHDASVAAGEAPDPSDLAIIQAFKSGDPAEQKRALSMVGLSVASINPKKFDETYKALMPNAGNKNVVVAAGSAIVDPETGEEIYRAPEKTEYRNVGQGDTVVALGGPSGGTPAGSSPEAALSTRLNNPGAIRFDPANQWQGQVGEENGFVRFDSVASGRRAHQKLIANQIKAGFDTPLKWAQRYAPASDGNDPNAYAQIVANDLGIGVNDKIPISAVPKVAATSARVEAGGTPAQPGGARIVAQGGQKPTYQVLTPEENRLLGLNPEVKYQRAPDGQITALGGQDTKTKAGRAVPQTAIEKISKRVEARDSLGRSLSTFRDDFGGNTITGSLENWLQGKFGTGTKGQRDWWANFYETDNQIRNDLFGSALTATEQAAYERTTITPSMQPSEIRENLRRRNTIIRKALDRQKRILLANKYEPDAVEALFSDDPLASQPQQATGGFRILAVRLK